jgi:hypothetical protein
MQFAPFAHVWDKADMSPAQRYQQLQRKLQVADTLVFDATLGRREDRI